MRTHTTTTGHPAGKGSNMTTTTCHTDCHIARPATDREAAVNGFGPNGEAVCAWCGIEATDLIVIGSHMNGQTYWSPAYCHTDCHVEAVDLG